MGTNKPVPTRQTRIPGMKVELEFSEIVTTPGIKDTRNEIAHVRRLTPHISCVLLFLPAKIGVYVEGNWDRVVDIIAREAKQNC